jgi:hypothetical protein
MEEERSEPTYKSAVGAKPPSSVAETSTFEMRGLITRRGLKEL